MVDIVHCLLTVQRKLYQWGDESLCVCVCVNIIICRYICMCVCAHAFYLMCVEQHESYMQIATTLCSSGYIDEMEVLDSRDLF